MTWLYAFNSATSSLAGIIIGIIIIIIVSSDDIQPSTVLLDQ